MGCLIYLLTRRSKVYIVHYMTENKCQKKCKLDKDTSICLGCNRTIEEIINAGNNAREEKAKARAEAEAQRDALQVDSVADDSSEHLS